MIFSFHFDGVCQQKANRYFVAISHSMNKRNYLIASVLW